MLHVKTKKNLLVLVLLLFFLSSSPGFSEDLKFTKIVDLETPWGSTFITDHELLVSEKYGKIKLVNLINKEITQIEHNLKYLSDGQGGLLDITYKDGTVWIAYSEDRGSSKTSTSIAKGSFNKSKIDFKNIFRAYPPIDSGYHFGSRLAIRGGHLFASVGERGKGMIAQDASKHPGSIIRIGLDGKPPKDNPRFRDKPEWLPEIYQIGVRNPQGLTVSPFDKKIYMSNHGARGGDWFGEATKGGNYGWKILGWGGTNYSYLPIGPKWKPGFTKAIYYWVPSIATSAIAIYKGQEFQKWNGHALITSLKDKSLRKLKFDNIANVTESIIFKNTIGRIRDIQVHPKDGKIYMLSQDALWLLENSK